MAARIRRDFHFFGAIYMQQEFNIDFFTITAYMDVQSISTDEQTIALERLKHLFTNCMDNTVFVHEDNKKIIDSFTNLGVRICTLPTEPYDQSIAIALLYKMSAITEGRLLVTNLIFKSHLSEGVEYLIDIDEPHGTYELKNNWWHDIGTNISSRKLNKKEKVLEIQKTSNDWTELNLGWKQSTNPENQIIFTLDNIKT